MKIKFYAQSAFRIVSDDGTRIVIDPYEESGFLRYDPTFDEADIVVVTHEHGDHNNVDAVPGDHDVVRGEGTHSARGIAFTGIPSFHDREQGAQRGPNAMMVFDVDGLTIAHLGDLGHELGDSDIEALAGTNVLIAAVGGGPTLEPDNVWEIVERVQPNVMIPCHFKTPEIDLPIEPLEVFLEGKPSVRVVGGSEVTITANELPDPVEITVLERSR